MGRVRANFVDGEVDDDPLGSGASTLNSPGLEDLPVVDGGDPDEFAVLVLDPMGGDPEVVHVTDHAADSSSATISRGEEGTSAQEWPQGTLWRHGLTAAELDELLTEASAGATYQLQRMVDVTHPDYGAEGDGSTDDTEAIQSAIDAADGRPVWFPPGTYRVTDTVTLPSNTTLDLAPDAVIDGTEAPKTGMLGDGLLQSEGDLTDTTDITAAVEPGDLTVDLADASPFSFGDFIFLQCDIMWRTNMPMQGETHTVVSVDGNTVQLREHVWGRYPTDENPKASKLDPITNVSVRGAGKIIGDPDPGETQEDAQSAVVFKNSANVMVEDVTFEGWTGRAICADRTMHLRVAGVHWAQMRGIDNTGGAGVAFQNGAQWGSVAGCTGDDVRHLVDNGGDSSDYGWSRFVTVTGCTVYGGRAAGLSMHGAGEFFVYEGNTISVSDESGHGIFIRGINVTLDGNIVYGGAGYGLLCEPDNGEKASYTIANNDIYPADGGEGIMIRCSQDIGDAEEPLTNVVVTGNTVRSQAFRVLTLQSRHGRAIRRGAISGNIVESPPDTEIWTGIFLIADEPSEGDLVEHIAITGNSVTVPDGRGIRSDNVQDCWVDGNLIVARDGEHLHGDWGSADIGDNREIDG
ncbi:hypothetical protein ER308_07160 [Egibacter rhizosphaerae]|uniref:Pectate lyase superfamily protein domain-containing protein n=1 Tax=Egibacter rhizosphaerae TaxID=1670831 RepID=A0A411YDN5_9ACTN|nr:glycosyl hydrolase family 28-related protein [Egibacter rhizosphaerae]QBI19344.1 hypothetical protein ER308_07160 [Egibacter rhizosphaerae]